ncbi:glycosyltransferase family 2 protein [Aneurinibacillus terranovensis]|uniref:glycosyltransferase family 2 protein n=1 Tax=Aneurinibacillus terranovensis TaxID=278991 RepID=UPI00042A926C|nr:glycosyltransferase [Aneurinibacillus terranovensis]
MKKYVRKRRVKGRNPSSVETAPQLSVIIPAKNEFRTIHKVVSEAKKIASNTEVIVVCNGTTDQTDWLAEKAGAKVISIKRPLGHDVGRAIGARHARGSVLLFIDADFMIPAKVLRGYYLAIKQGYDIALNGYSGIQTENRIHSVSVAKQLINKLNGRPDLQGSSMTTVPHALSRKAAKMIGYDNLAVPPKAQVKALLQGLAVKRLPTINVTRRNKKRNRRKNMMVELVLGDHAEAIKYLISEKGARGGFSDFNRKREAVYTALPEPTGRSLIQTTVSSLLSAISLKPDSAPGLEPIWKAFQSSVPSVTSIKKILVPVNVEKSTQTLSVIICAHNEESTIDALLVNVKELKPKEIIVVENGSNDRTRDICVSHGVTCYSYPECLGHDVGRAIGARVATGDVFLFIDADIVFTPEQLGPFIEACKDGADVALNNVNPFYLHRSMIDYVSMAKLFLNRLTKHLHLGFSSLTAIPHAIRREAVEIIGADNLFVPPKAQAIAAIRGLTIRNVQGVNVFHSNKLRPYNIDKANEVESLIIGDHLEALQWLQTVYGERVLFQDELRRREYLTQ